MVPDSIDVGEEWDFLESCGVCEEIEEEEEEEKEQTPRKRVKRGHVNVDKLSRSIWGQMLSHPDINNPNSYTGMSFRLRFRVPYGLFQNVLVPQCIERNVFDEKRPSQIPI